MTFLGEAKTVRKPRPTKQTILASDWSKNVACRRGTKRTKVPAVTHSRSRKLASGTCPIRRVNCLDRPPSPSRTHRARLAAIRTSPPARSRLPIRCRTVPGINRLIRAPRPPHTGQDACRVPRDRPHGPGGRRQRRRRRPHLRELRCRGSRIRQGCFRQVPRALVRLLTSSEPRTPAASIPRSPPRRIPRLGTRASIDPPRARTHRRPGDGTIVPWRHRRCIPRGTTARVSERRRSTPRRNPRCQTSPRPHSPRRCFFWFFFGFFVKRIADPFPSPCPTTGEATASR